LALGFLATKARSDVLTLSIPADLASELLGAREHLSSPEAVAVADGRLAARRELLDELIKVAVDEAGDQVGLASARLLRGDGSAAEVRARIATLNGLLDLLDGLSRVS
jgi:hypothetical protein